jgi:hypothetical protein
MPSSRDVGLALALAVTPGCQDKLPSAPSELLTGITVYEHANFMGQSAHITSDIEDLRDFSGPCLRPDGDGTPSEDWNDCISSVRVAPGWRATIYKDTGYRDDSLEVTGDVPNLQVVAGDCSKGGLNDCVSSVRVRAP